VVTLSQGVLVGKPGDIKTIYEYYGNNGSGMRFVYKFGEMGGIALKRSDLTNNLN
jgi:hypothetical protein